MKLIQSLSYSSARYLSKELNQDHRKRSEYYFGFQAVYGAIIKMIILLGLASIFGCIQTTIIVAIVFASLRFFAGGVHMNTYKQCISITMLFFIPAAAISEWVHFSRLAFYILLTLIIIIPPFSIIRWAPKDCPLNQMSQKSKDKLKKYSFVALAFWVLSSFVFQYFNNDKGAIAIYLALLIETSTFIPTTANYYTKLNDMLDRRKT